MSIIHSNRFLNLATKSFKIGVVIPKSFITTSYPLFFADHVDPSTQHQQQHKTASNLNTSTRRTGVIAIKKGMTAIWDPWGVRVPVTLLQLEKVYVTQQKIPRVDGYYGLQVGAVQVKNDFRINRAQLIHCKLNNVPFGLKKYCGFQVTKNAMLPVGTQLFTNHYQVGEYVDVTAVSIGKGFAGVIKRWGFKGQGASHGVSLTHRHPGSIGQCQDPGKVWKNKKMPGRLGGKQVTVFGLQIVQIDHDANILYVRGAVPGHDNQFVKVRDCLKKFKRISGPSPTDSCPKSGIDLMPKVGEDPYLKF